MSDEQLVELEPLEVHWPESDPGKRIVCSGKIKKGELVEDVWYMVKKRGEIYRVNDGEEKEEEVDPECREWLKWLGRRILV